MPTPHPAHRPARPAYPELAEVPAVYGYRFILKNLEVSAPGQAAAAEHWYGTALPSSTSSLRASRTVAPVDGHR